ncbi:MAG TPA: hypothetical protein VFQ77_00200 [Pseudonocardiaceae bacterium]|jgi:hypothetical protein|nr:hypothetical protein [Pseudonocardiaceae bacterium]
MSFTAQDEDAFHRRRDELLEQFAAWCAAAPVPEGTLAYAEVAMDWKWAYHDGDLGRWTVADLEEFLLGWCPSKLAVPPDECAAIPQSVRAFLTFLASQGLLAPGSSTLAQLQRCCEQNTARFVTEMPDPGNYGVAKGLATLLGGLGPGPEEMPIRTVGPVTGPDPDERAHSAATAPVLAQLQGLWEFCAAPGRPLTPKGNLRLADARHLVELLGTGDVPDPEFLGHRRSLRSADDLTVLSWLVELGLGARMLRRHRGKLVAVARWCELSPVAALDRLVDTAIAAGLSGFRASLAPWVDQVRDLVDGGAGRLLAELLDARAGGRPLPIEEVADLMIDMVVRSFFGLPEIQLGFVHNWIRTQVERLAALGVVTIHDVREVRNDWGGVEKHGGVAELTPAGVPIAVRHAEQLGIIVLRRADPATATARDLISVLDRMAAEDWIADATAWVAHRGPEVAAREIVAVLNDGQIRAPVVFVALGQLNELVGEHALPAIRTMLGGPHDSLALQVVLMAGGLEPAEVDQDRLVRSVIELMAVMYDIGGLDHLLGMLNTESPHLVDLLWAADHPRTAELLEMIAEQHPVKAVTKAAGKALLRHRSRRASRG